MGFEIELRAVRKKTGGRIHLTVGRPRAGPVRTLCGIVLGEDSYRSAEEQADCRICSRRRQNPALVSSAFFQQEAGEELLELALRQARERRASRPRPEVASAPGPGGNGLPARRHPPAAGRGRLERAKPPAKAERAASRMRGELRTAGLRRFSDRVYQSPAGVTLRVKETAKGWEVLELVFQGAVRLERAAGDRLVARFGDVRAVFSVADEGLRAGYELDA